jgi:hypothetical protein
MSSPRERGKNKRKKFGDDIQESDFVLNGDQDSPGKQQMGVSFEDSENSRVFGDDSSGVGASKETTPKIQKQPTKTKARPKPVDSDKNSFVDMGSERGSGGPPDSPPRKQKKLLGSDDEPQEGRRPKPKVKVNKVEDFSDEYSPPPEQKYRSNAPQVKKEAVSWKSQTQKLGLAAKLGALDREASPDGSSDANVEPFSKTVPRDGLRDSERAPTKDAMKSVTGKQRQFLLNDDYTAPISKADHANDLDRSKSTNRVFRKLGLKNDPGDGNRSALRDSTPDAEPKKRAFSRNVFMERNKGDEPMERPNVAELLKQRVIKPRDKTPTREEPADDKANESTLGRKLKQILEGDRSKSPILSRLNKDDKKTDLTGSRVRDRSPLVQAILAKSSRKNGSDGPQDPLKVDDVQPEARFNEIRNRVLQQRAKSRNMAPRPFDQKANVFNNDDGGREDPYRGEEEEAAPPSNPNNPPIHRSFLKDNRNSDLQAQLAEATKLGMGEGRKSRLRKIGLSETDIVEPHNDQAPNEDAPELTNYRSMREKMKQMRQEEGDDRAQKRRTDSNDGDEPVAKNSLFDRKGSRARKATGEDGGLRSSPLVKRHSEEGEWWKSEGRKAEFSDVKKFLDHQNETESIDLSENLLATTQLDMEDDLTTTFGHKRGKMGDSKRISSKRQIPRHDDDDDAHLGTLLSPGKMGEDHLVMESPDSRSPQRKSLLKDGKAMFRDDDGEGGFAPKLIKAHSSVRSIQDGLHKKESEDQDSHKNPDERKVSTKIALAALEMGELPDLDDHPEEPAPKMSESQRLVKGQKSQITLAPKKAEAEERPLSMKRSTANFGDERPLKTASSTTYNYDDPNFKDTYVPSGKAGRSILPRKSKNPVLEELPVDQPPAQTEEPERKSLILKKMSAEVPKGQGQEVEPPKEGVATLGAEAGSPTMGVGKITGKKVVDAEEAKSIPSSTFVNPDLGKPAAQPPAEAGEDLLTIEMGPPKSKGPKMPIGVKPPKRTEVAAEQEPGAEDKREGDQQKTESADPPAEEAKKGGPTSNLRAARLKAKEDPAKTEEPPAPPAESTQEGGGDALLTIVEAPKRPMPKGRFQAQAKKAEDAIEIAVPEKKADGEKKAEAEGLPQEEKKPEAKDDIDMLNIVEPAKKPPAKGRFAAPAKPKAEAPETADDKQAPPAPEPPKPVPEASASGKGDEDLMNIVEPAKKPPVRNRFAAQKQAQEAGGDAVAAEKPKAEPKPEGEGDLMTIVEPPKKGGPPNRFQKPAPKAAAETGDDIVIAAPKAPAAPPKPEEKKPEEAKAEPPKAEEKPPEEKKPGDPSPPPAPDAAAAGDKPKEEAAENPDSLAFKLKSANFKLRQEAYTEIMSWKNPEVTPEIFAKNLHNYVKDKHPVSIEALMATADSFFDNHPQLFAQVDFKGLIENVAEHLLSNVKGTSKEKAMEFVVRVWELSNFDQFLDQLNALLTSGKPKRQEACLNMVMELIKNHKIEEMKQVKPLWPEIGKLIGSRTVALKNMTIELYKEAYLWIKDALRPFLKDLKKPQMDDLESYFKGLDPSKFKKVEKRVREKKAPPPPPAPAQQPAAAQPGASASVTSSKPAEPLKETVNPDEVIKAFNTPAWSTQILGMKVAKEQAAKIEEVNDKLNKLEALNPKTSYEPLIGVATKLLSGPAPEAKIAAAHLVKVLAEKLGKDLGPSAKSLQKLMLPKIGDKATSDAMVPALVQLSTALTLDDILEDLKAALASKSTDQILQTLLFLKGVGEQENRLAHSDKSVKLCELAVKFSEEKNSEVKTAAHQVLAGQLTINEAKVQPLLKGVSPASMNNVNQIASSIRLNTKAGQMKDDVDPAADGKGRANAKSNVQRISQIREDALGNKIVKTSDAKQFPAHLVKNINFLVEATGEFKNLFPEEAAEIIGFVEAMLKLEKLTLSEAVRLPIYQFFAEQFNNGYTEQLQASFDQFYTATLKSANNKVILEGLLGLLLKKQIRLGKEFFQVLVGMFDKETGNQAAVTGLPLKQFTDFLKLQFGPEGIQIVFKRLLTNTMRLLMKKFGDQSVADFPPVILHEFDAINEAQRVFEKIIEKLNDRNPEKRKAALIDLANYSDPSTILTFWSNDKFVSFLKRQITIETKSSNYLVLIKILDHYLDIRTISFADFNIKTFIFIFHAVLMNLYDRKDDPHAREIEALIKKSVTVLTPAVIVSEMIAADSATFSWREQILHFLNEHSAEVEPSLKIMNYLIQLLGQKNPSKEFQDLLNKIFLRYKTASNPEIIAKGNEIRAIRDIWAKNEEDLILNAEFLQGTDLFEKPAVMKATREYLMRALKLDEKSFYVRNISLLDFKGSEASFKTKMAFWLIRSVENDVRNNMYIINQIFAKSAFEDDDIAVGMALKIALQILKNNFFGSDKKCLSVCLSLLQQIVSGAGNERLGQLADMLSLDHIDLEFFKFMIDQAVAHHSEEYGGNGAAARVVEYRPDQLPRGVNNTQNLQQTYVPAVPANRMPNQGRDYDYEPEYASAQKYQDQYGGERDSADANASQMNIRGNVKRREEDLPLENDLRLQDMFNLMRTYQLDEFETASNYFKELCASKKVGSINFLIKNRDEILENFVEVCQVIFNEGINYELKKPDYELIFVPLVQLFEKENFLLSMTREKTLSLCEFLISKFIGANEEKKMGAGQDRESIETAEYIVKVWNTLLIRLVDNANPNFTLASLFLLVNNCPKQQQSKVVEAEVNLALRCILRISKAISKHISGMDAAVVLDCVAQYMNMFDTHDLDDFGNKVIKNLLTEFVNNSDPDMIMETYSVMFGMNEESQLYKWISTILNGPGNDDSRIDRRGRSPKDDGSAHMTDLINDLNKQTGNVQMKNYYSRFQKILTAYPNLRLRQFEQYFVVPEHFKHIVKALSVHSAMNPQDPKAQTGKVPKSGEPKTLQATSMSLGSKNPQGARKAPAGRGRNNLNDISEIRDGD